MSDFTCPGMCSICPSPPDQPCPKVIVREEETARFVVVRLSPDEWVIQDSESGAYVSHWAENMSGSRFWVEWSGTQSIAEIMDKATADRRIIALGDYMATAADREAREAQEKDGLFVDAGLGGATFMTMRLGPSGGRHRVKSPALPVRNTREEAEADLAAYRAKKKG